MFDSLYQAETDQALAFEAAAPRRTPKAEPGLFSGTGTAVVSGLQQGALETGRAAINAAVAAYRLGGFDREDRAKTLAERFNQPEPELARQLGAAARKWDPDPETMGTAAQMVQGFARVGGKAAGYIAATGGLGGLAGLGVDEGISEGLKLSDRGVDAATAAQAGAIHGIATAVGAALPAAGVTKLATAGLVAAGGPGLFVAEQALIRDILRDAGHDRIAAEYDPWDMTGLAASTLLPGAVGAASHLLRVKPKAPAADKSPFTAPPDELVDAARVALLDQHDLDVVQGRAKAEGKPLVDAMAEQPAGRAAAAERIDAGEPTVSRETAAPAAVADPIEQAAKASEPAPAAAKAAEVDHPDVAAVRARLKEADFDFRTEDGRTMKASEAFAEAEAAAKQGETEAGAFRAAVTCFLGG